jgi:hypothetical protein
MGSKDAPIDLDEIEVDGGMKRKKLLHFSYCG